MITDNDRFEVLAALYQRDTAFIAPGKDSAIEDTSDPANIERFRNWIQVRSPGSVMDALCTSIEALRAAYGALSTEQIRIAPFELGALSTVYEALRDVGVEL